MANPNQGAFGEYSDINLGKSTFSQKSKYLISALIGIISLLLSQFGISVMLGEISLDIPWSVILPMIIAIAYGPRFGLIAGITGGALHPFLLWTANGVPNVLTTILMVGLYASLGLLTFYKNTGNFKALFVRLFQILFVFIAALAIGYYYIFPFLLEFNPPFWTKFAITEIDHSILISFIIKDAINFSLMAIAAEMLLCIPLIRKYLGLPISNLMRLNGKIFVFTMLIAIIIWLFFVVLDVIILKDNAGIKDGHFALALLVFVWCGILVARVLVSFIEKRLETEISLKESKEKFKTFFENSPDAIFLAETETKIIIDANRSASDLLLKPIKEIIGMHQSELHPPDFENFSKETFKNQSNESDFIKRFQPVENRVIRSDGIEIPVEILASPIMINGKKAIQGVFRDITERKIAQENLQFKDFAIQSSISAIGLADLSGKLIFANKAYIKMWGYATEKEVLGRHIAEFSDSQEQVSEIMQTLMRGEKYIGESLSKRKDGSTFYIQVVANLVYSSTGKPICLMASLLDISDKKSAEEELILAKDRAEESDFLKSAFLANMSHEIRTPMNAILGFSQLLEADDIDESDKKEYLQYIHRRGNDLLNIINDILIISKIDAHQLTIQKTEDDLNILLEEILEIFSVKNTFENHKSVKLYISDRLEQKNFVITDFARVKQILVNLVGNALKFTEQGSIEFGCSVENALIIFYVKDTGIGIPYDKKGIIFERFRQIEENSTSRQYGGTGLGLSICKGLVELLGGEIWLESEVGKGTTFYFAIPYEASKQNSKKHIPDSTENYDFSNKQILIVEDDEFNAMLLIKYMQLAKANYLLAPNGNSALELYKNNRNIDVVLLDLQLPDISGYEVAKAIIEFDPSAKLIAQTAYAYSEDKVSAFAVGCCDYITKPIRMEKLFSMIKKHI